MNAKIERRVTVLWTLLILLVVKGFSEIFAVRAPNGRSDDKEEKQAKKDYYEPSNCVLEIVYVLGNNRVQREFYRKSSKM